MTMPNDLICPDFGLKKGYYYSGGIAFWVWTGLNRHFSQDWAVVSGCKWCKWCQSPLSRVTWPSPTARVHQVVTHGSLMMLVFWMFRGDLRFEFTTSLRPSRYSSHGCCCSTFISQPKLRCLSLPWSTTENKRHYGQLLIFL